MHLQHASSLWQGTVKEGSGTIFTESGGLNYIPYSYGSRFEDKVGTNPEELIAAAHAACFSMALAIEIEKAEFTPENLKTAATVTLEKQGENWEVTSSRLRVEARVPGMEQSKLDELAEVAKTNCPISRLLKTEISVETKLEDGFSENRTQSTDSSETSGTINL